MINLPNSSENVFMRYVQQASLVFLFISIAFTSTNTVAETPSDAKRIAAVDLVIDSLEEFGNDSGTYYLEGAGHGGMGQGWFHYSGGQYTTSIANHLVSQGLLDTPEPKDPLLQDYGTYDPYDFLVYRCLDRIAVFSRSDELIASESDTSWWKSNHCTQYPIVDLSHPYFKLSDPSTDLSIDRDAMRVTAVDLVISALEKFGSDSGTYHLEGSGHGGMGQGWFHYSGGRYTTSIADHLVSLGLLDSPEPKDPLLQKYGAYDPYDFLVYRCLDRIAVFSRSDEIVASESDTSWWENNRCTQYPIVDLSHPYFKLSEPSIDLSIDRDAMRITAVDLVVSALEKFGDDSGTYFLDGAGYRGTGQGWFHYSEGQYTTSIADYLASQGLLDAPKPKDSLLQNYGTYDPYDFLVFRCLDRIAVFSRSDEIVASESDTSWWVNNHCTQYPILDLSHPYFKLSEPILLAGSYPRLDKYELTFFDEFNAPIGSAIDQEKWDSSFLWGPYLPINNEEQMYIDVLGIHRGFTRSPFEYTGSTLKIIAQSTDNDVKPPLRPSENDPLWQPREYSEYRYNGATDDDPGYLESNVNYLSGILTTYQSFKMTHGYVEIRAKLPRGQGLWPAFWLLPVHYIEKVPEIDVMEFLGNDDQLVYHTYHYFDVEDNWRKISTPSFTTVSKNWTLDFHTYGMAWSPTEIIWYVDGTESRRITSEEYEIPNQAMYILVNLAVGGNWPGAPDLETKFPAEFEIDYVRAYQRKLESDLDLDADYQLMFEDDFNNTSIDQSKWNTHFLWGPYLAINNEEQYYVDALGVDSVNLTNENTPFVINEGVLSITARLGNDINSFPIPASLPDTSDSIWAEYKTFSEAIDYVQPKYSSGILTTYDSFKFSHGYAEISARIPAGDGLWPAFWLLNGYYVGSQPEIDVMEARGEFPGQITHSYHRLVDGSMVSTSALTDSLTVDYSKDFHLYGVRWHAGRIDWYIDNTLVNTYIGDDVGYQVMYLLINLAVGGDFNGETPTDEGVFNATLPVTFDIDYVRVYQEKHK